MVTACSEPGFFVSATGRHDTQARNAMKPSRSYRPLERSALTLGFVPLTDCAPLIAAQSAGFFAEEGLTVTLSREASWAAIRDKVAFGLLDGAQMLAGMPIAATLGVGAPPQAMVTALSLGLNGNAITVSEGLYSRLVAADPEAMIERPCTARALKRVIDADREAGLAPMTFAMVHPASAHNYQLRYWLAAAGIDPDRDVRLIVVPPPRMVANLEAGRIAGYCVGEPWNQMAVRAGLGRVLITGYEIWRNAPEKVLGVTRDWAERHPNTHRALVRALVRAARWLDEPANRRGIVTRLAAPDRLDAPAEAIRGPLVGEFRHAREAASVSLPDFNVFHRYAANFPWCSQAMWFITQMLRWGQIGGSLDIAATAAAVYRPGIYREAVADIGVACPDTDTKSEGRHAEGWALATNDGAIAMGADRFFDGRVFDPADCLGYIAETQPTARTARLAELAQVNPSNRSSVAG
ncbi:nitrate transporter [Salinisphaera orenii MK-B5]|uniref:Nitrate transporter n=2 Tax=Salinisphaera TaxID=180541 RepID=A0A423PNU0_9GAMM|nr:nitrate transporter [Salinisphaera orenii MK-B5]